MKKIYSHLLRVFICISFFTVLLNPAISLADKCEKWVAKVVSVQGIVQAKKAGETQWQAVKLNDTYCPGDVIWTQGKSRADIALINQPVLRLDQNTTITLGGLKDERTSVLDLLNGAAHFFSRVTRGLEVHTAFVNAGVEGTEFFIRVEEDKTLLSIFEGKVLASNKAGSLAIASGQSAVAEKGKAPVPYIVVRPRDAVQWALYYPPVIYRCPEELKENDPRFYTCRASSLLQVGRVDEAKADIEKALTIDPNNSHALALESVIAVVQNDKEKALSLARKAVEADPKSASARIALSYAQQANFDLKGALESLKEAVKLEPDNALAWARLSEMRLSFGELDESLKAAEKAAELNPDIARTQTVLGFAYLMQVKTKESKTAFEKAIKLDNSDPLPRLGLGLAKIREGDLKEGDREIEIAASLDPDNSLIRSYLGKGYFEEKREKQSSEEYTMAKNLDPLDPTPLFYDAIQKQTTNRPVEALHDMEKAIELNDNRMVYRSQQLLDEDLAARSAGLARIYSDLGFQELALVEGWKSVNTDPTDFSGHRFLADSYSVLPRHEIARVSELLQSQLLQPLNMTPIQPSLAESNLFLISAGGPAALSFNEFNPLFNRNQIALQTSGIVGENDTWGTEGVISGIYKNFSISTGYTHFKTDGWRKNAEQNDDIANVFLQMEISPQTSIQAEYRNRELEIGDVALRFFPQDVFFGQTNTEVVNSYRVGVRHNLSADSIILGSFIYQDANFGIVDKQPVVAPGIVTALDITNPQDAFSGEVQHLFRSRYVNLTSGVGYVDSDGHIDSIITFATLGAVKGHVPSDLRHTNIYAYSYIKPLSNLTFTLGASGDIVNGDSPDFKDRSQFNPKFGIIWSPVPDTTIRAAVFRTLKRTLVTNQTLEPTQVAGFNQFFDDFDATKAWRYGIAVDQKISKDIFGGAEFSRRNTDVPAFDLSGNAIEADWDETLVRAYLFWTPHPWISLRAEYQYERIERDKAFTNGVEDMDTHRVPLGINFFHPSGFSASVTTTYYNQDGEFEHIIFGGGTFQSGKDDFWLVDAAVNYRLPKRYGIITVGAKNVFDKKFRYFDLDVTNPSIQPSRFVFAKVTLALP